MGVSPLEGKLGLPQPRPCPHREPLPVGAVPGLQLGSVILTQDSGCYADPQAADNPAGRQPWELGPREERALPPAGYTPAPRRPAAGRCGSHRTLGLLLIQAWRPCWGSRAGKRAGCPCDPSSPGPWMHTGPISCPRLWDAILRHTGNRVCGWAQDVVMSYRQGTEARSQH